MKFQSSILFLAAAYITSCAAPGDSEQPVTPEVPLFEEDYAEDGAADLQKDASAQVHMRNIPQFEIDEQLADLAADPGVEYLKEIEFVDWVSYFTSYYSNGHNHPGIVYNPGKEKFIVSGRHYQAWFNRTDIDDAISAYRELLWNCGYGQEILFDDREEVETSYNDLFPNETMCKMHFSDEQYEALKAVSPTQGYAYFAGFGIENWHFPGMFAFANEGIDMLQLMGPEGMAAEIEMEAVDSAFGVYVDYIDKHF